MPHPIIEESLMVKLKFSLIYTSSAPGAPVKASRKMCDITPELPARGNIAIAPKEINAPRYPMNNGKIYRISMINPTT
jgi:hypothetical protein